MFLVASRSLGAFTREIIGLMAISLLGAQVIRYVDPLAGFYLLPFRAWELLAGALLAKLDADDELPAASPRPHLLAIGGAALLIGSMLLFRSKTPHPSVYTLPAVVGACLLVRYGAHGPVGRFLSLPIMVGVGLISYSLYLLHWPKFRFVRVTHFEAPSAATMAVATLFELRLCH